MVASYAASSPGFCRADCFRSGSCSSRIYRGHQPARSIGTPYLPGTTRRDRPKSRPSRPALVGLKPGGSRPPLFLIAPGDTTFPYRHLARRFEPDRPLFGLEPPIDLDRTPRSDAVERQAARYVRDIWAKQAEGPYHLGGWSGGGLIAFEVA